MKTTEILIREDETRVRIDVDFRCNNAPGFADRFEYTIQLLTRAKGKRKWQDVIDRDNFQYRRSEDRSAYCKAIYLEVVTEEEILHALKKAHKQLAPTEWVARP